MPTLIGRICITGTKPKYVTDYGLRIKQCVKPSCQLLRN